jgi:hypothetical protein
MTFVTLLTNCVPFTGLSIMKYAAKEMVVYNHVQEYSHDGLVPEAYVICHTQTAQTTIHIEERLLDRERIDRTKTFEEKDGLGIQKRTK